MKIIQEMEYVKPLEPMKVFKKGKVSLYQGDNMEFMAKVPDNYYDLACIDPPYGINHSEIAGKQSGTQYGKAAAAKKTYIIKDWDKKIPPPEYFKQLFRVSKNQIIWGANYIVEFLKPSMGWIFWDKNNGTNNFSDGELAFSSFEKGLRKVKVTWNGMIQQDMKNKEIRIHPTQKPVKLYDWIFHNYAQKDFKVFDSHGGSMSSAIAAYYYGCEFDGIELDKDYYNDAVKRFKTQTMQTKLF